MVCRSIIYKEPKGLLLGRTNEMIGLFGRNENERDELRKVQQHLFQLFIK